MVEKRTATVYYGGGRRWFTLDAACNAEARAKIKTRCECCGGDEVTPGETCFYHGPDNYPTIKRRLARIYKQAFFNIR